jgi:hypothetical protein
MWVSTWHGTVLAYAREDVLQHRWVSEREITISSWLIDAKTDFVAQTKHSQ